MQEQTATLSGHALKKQYVTELLTVNVLLPPSLLYIHFPTMLTFSDVVLA